MLDPPPQQPLEYRSPPDAHEHPTPPFGFAVGAIIGFTLYLAAGFLLLALMWFVVPSMLMLVVAAPVLIAGLAVFTVYSNARWGWRGLSVGILIGLGLTLLIPGICFVVLINA